MTLGKSLPTLGLGIVRMILRSSGYLVSQGPPHSVYGFLLLRVLISDSPGLNRLWTSSDMAGVEVQINLPKETNSPARSIVRTFVLESGLHNQNQGNSLSSAV